MAIETMLNFIENILSLYKFKCYRKWKGGHWEKWIIDFPFCSNIWLQVDRCIKKPGVERPPLGRSIPTCEDYQ
jgi:hypothetical protein